MKFLAGFLAVLLLAVGTTAVVTRKTTEPQQPSLADKIDHACKKGYRMYDWSVYDSHLLMVTCAHFGRDGLLEDQYVAPVAT